MMYNDLLDTDPHNSDTFDLGPAKIRGQEIDRVRLIGIDKEAMAERNIGDIRRNIAVRRAREQKENHDAAGN
jgi:hypothetical protein